MPVVAYLWTCVIEIPIVLLALRRAGWMRTAIPDRTGEPSGSQRTGEHPESGGAAELRGAPSGGRARRDPGTVAAVPVRVALAAWLVQFTQPVLWFFGPRELVPLIVAEVLVWQLEGVAVWALLRNRVPGARLPDALAAAVLANAASFAFGLAFPGLVGG